MDSVDSKHTTVPRWRVGRQLGRTLYCNDICVGMVDTPELALEIITALNYEGCALDPATVEACARLIETGFDRYRVDGMAGWAPVESLANDLRMLVQSTELHGTVRDSVDAQSKEGK